MPLDLDDFVSRLRARFNPEILSASAAVHGGTEGVARQLERLRGYRLRTLVEVGTRFGAMAALLSRVAERVVTIDLHQAVVVAEVLEFAQARNVAPICIGSNAAKGLLLDSLSFDLAFLDGDHTAEGVAFDFAHTRRCGVVLFHDYGDPGFHGVTDFVDSLSEGAIVRDAPFAWWFAPGVEPFGGRERRPSILHGTPLCCGR